jgi:hypothetical protein
MVAMKISMNVDSPGMAGFQFLMLHVRKQHISWIGLNCCDVCLPPYITKPKCMLRYSTDEI